MVAGNDTPLAIPAKLRSGSPRFGYSYEQRAPYLWKCQRGSENADTNTKLFLTHRDGFWTAFDAPETSDTSEAVELVGVPIFRSKDAVTQQGVHKWETYENDRWVAKGWQFKTSILVVSTSSRPSLL